MKKSFVYLICVLLMAAMLCGCGVSSTDSGMVSSSPAQTLPTASATVMPTTSPMACFTVQRDKYSGRYKHELYSYSRAGA